MNAFKTNRTVRSAGRRVALLRAGPALLAIALATPAFAQDSAADGAENAPEAIVITGSRITSPNFSAPTPVQAIDAAQIAQNAQPNIFTTIAQLPSLQGSTGTTVATNSTSSGVQGLSAFALHGLGTIRTLTLLDGQRVVGANVNGTPDISLFPQLLVKRVDVVTGGASASYGSDAVGGVVNFITDTRFEGLKANVQFGVSTYGDNFQRTFQAAYGTSLMDGRLHVIVSGEYDDEDGVGAGGYGEELAKGRDWYRTTTFFDNGVSPAGGGPQYTVGDHAQAYQYTKYGLITNGPLQGTAFDVNGNPFPFQYGTSLGGAQGVPAKNAAGTVTNCYSAGGFCVGGDLSGNVGIGTTLQSAIERINGYTRIGFDITPSIEYYVTINVSQVKSSNQPNPGASKTGSTTGVTSGSALALKCSNPYVPASIQALCTTNNITSFGFGVSNAILPNIVVAPTRNQYRIVSGLKGNVNLIGTNWIFDSYYEHGENITDITVSNIMLNTRYNMAIDATTLNGTIVCANATARANGCQPLNIIGGTPPSAASKAYFMPDAGPYQHTRQTQNVASLNVSGEPLSLWAGPISVATGAEWRQEFYKVTGDPYSNTNGAASGPEAALYPVDTQLSASGGNWYAGNYRNGRGKYSVYEGYLELNIPYLDSEGLGKASLNLGARATHYSTSGTVYTWKIGGTWDTPVDGIRFRAVTSRDIRAPNLSELYAAGTTTNVPNFSNPYADAAKGIPAAVTIAQISSGNPNLKPEVARNTVIGAVLSRPSWAPGLNLSVDYYRISMRDVVGSLSARQVVDYCFNNIANTCAGHNLNTSGSAYYVITGNFNLAKVVTDGLDIEASYQWQHPFGLGGNLTWRTLATNVFKYVTTQGLPGTEPTDSAGVNAGSIPDWKILSSQTWSTDSWRLTVQERWFSDGVFSNSYVVCQSGCPASTSLHRTINRNTMPGALYVDISGSYDLFKGAQAYFKVDNLFNKDPIPSPQTNTGIDVNPGLYDVIGRMYRVGVRFNF